MLYILDYRFFSQTNGKYGTNSLPVFLTLFVVLYVQICEILKKYIEPVQSLRDSSPLLHSLLKSINHC